MPVLKTALQILAVALIGVIAGMIFVFLFPKGAITTLVHYVLRLPGPGAGIAIIVGPFLIFFMLVANQLNRSRGVAFLTALFFSVTLFIAINVCAVAMDPKGMFGSLWFILVVAICGLSAEVMLQLARNIKLLWRLMITAAVANLTLLLLYWLIIFPQSAGWIAWRHVPILIAVCMAGSLAASICAWVIAKLH